MTVSQETLDEIALSRSEYEAIIDRLGREPNSLELGLFGALWSEHCGYKHTKALLRTLPSSSERLLVAPGAENAGVIDLGDGLAVAFKIESHNHPSAIEPFEGAATGVGGIIRDIFAMGARPIALLNSLRFGQPDDARTRYLINGVIGGISSYGNCIGIPDVGGEIFFSDTYKGNPLVNAMCVGLIEDGKMASASAKEPGDLLILVGADTGRDGIHGASGLASRAFEEQAEMRSAVQVGNPFLEKVLIEACIESLDLPGVVGLQDCGAAGITSAAIEMAERSGMGLKLLIDEVPRREEGMTPYEVMLSESQERMLLAVTPGLEGPVFELFEKWDLDATVIGEFELGEDVRIYDEGEEVSSTPVITLTDAPEYKFTGTKPDWLEVLQNVDLSATPLSTESPASTLLKMLASPNIASRFPIYQQYDYHVQTNTVVEPGGDAAVLRLKGSKRGIAVSTDCNGRICYLDPEVGTVIAVAEACRNLSVTGAEPVALTDGLNFGNPETADVQFQLTESIAGMSRAAEAFGIPIVSGNASLYNQSNGIDIFPTPIIGSLGLLEDVSKHSTAGFKSAGDVIVLLGTDSAWDDIDGLAGSEYLDLVHGKVEGQPRIDLDLEIRTQAMCREAIANDLVASGHDVSDGGVACAIAESAIIGGIGAVITEAPGDRWDAAMFGETQSRIVLSVTSENLSAVEALAAAQNIPMVVVGTVGGDSVLFGDDVAVSLDDVGDAWKNGFNRATSD
ncbi:MAG TPA: phosphoribosylformylglycinamidine synthase subunit PurL [Dehalococcoidia bacterium]|nr:phosphoribosylformylglycinamidine synthase subunit PurL [Dehalococcoidia bacterium]HIK88455.1 phosphoribosylformylglycinamidine synthase subunit PurL [Dehalococcoidia bacterium]